MATKSSRTSTTFARHVAPFAPLALAVAMNAVPASTGGNAAVSENVTPDNVTAVRCEENIADFQACHENYPTGCSAAAGYDPYLNYLKNLTPSPGAGVNFLAQSDFDNLNTNTPSDLGQGNNHADYKEQLANLGEGRQFGVIGYLYYYQATGAESSNCELTGPDAEGGNVDFHIGIGFDSDLAAKVDGRAKPAAALKKQLQQNSVIVEMTPHYRAQFHANDWTLANLKPALGHKVRVIGQLLVDSEHNKPADNCALEDKTAHCWRYSIWELHPVTVFEYCQDDSCTQGSDNWIPIGGTASAGNPSSGDNSGDSTGGEAGAGRRPRGTTRTATPRSDSAARP